MSPLGLKGPCSQKAPAPRDEHPGPTISKHGVPLTNAVQMLSSAQLIRGFGATTISESRIKPVDHRKIWAWVFFPTHLHWTRGQGASEKGRFLPQQGSKRELCAPSHRWWCNPSAAGSSLRAVLVSSWFYRTVLDRYGGECCRSLQLQSMALPSFPHTQRERERLEKKVSKAKDGTFSRARYRCCPSYTCTWKSKN